MWVSLYARLRRRDRPGEHRANDRHLPVGRRRSSTVDLTSAGHIRLGGDSGSLDPGCAPHFAH